MSDYCRRKAEEAALSKWADCPDFDWSRPRMRPMRIGAATKPPPPPRERELTEALQRTKAALHLLQPALNVMARECLADIIAREIDLVLSTQEQASA
jgi:hypothetical protein